MSPLVLHDVVKSYRIGHEATCVLDKVSLTVHPGELSALYGPSGSGKTTLLMLAVGLLSADRGRVSFNGRDIHNLSEREGSRYRRREVGFIFQEFHLSGGATALDNVTTKLTGDGFTLRHARRLARPWLDQVGLSDRAEQMPSELSMGERQRVAIARALVNKPSLLLADEPTGNLDARHTRQILGLLRDICHTQKIPGLLVTHDPEAVTFVDHVYTLCEGHLSDGLDADLATVSLP